MNESKQGRGVLKSYFKKNSIPTEDNFAQLMDGVLNLNDDGIGIASDNTIGIKASGDSASLKKVLNLYDNFDADDDDDEATWSFCLNPRGNPKNAKTASRGLSVNNAQSMSRFFISEDTGNVGVGTVTPSNKLTVADGDLSIEGGKYRRLKIVSDTHWAGIEIVAREGEGKDAHPHIDFTHGNLDAPNFGVRLMAPDNNSLRVDGGNLGIKRDPSHPLDVNGIVRADNCLIGKWPAGNTWSFMGHHKLDHSNAQNYALMQRNDGYTLLNSPLKMALRFKNSDRLIIDENLITAKKPLNVDGRVKAQGAQIGNWPADGNYAYVGHGNLDQSQGKNYGVLLHKGGNSYFNSPTKLHLRIENGDKIVIEKEKVTLNKNLTVATGANLFFANKTRQMINLWGKDYGIGIQSNTQYYRSAANFAWFCKGSHNDGGYNPGSGGKRLMAINSAGDFILSARTNPTGASNKSACRALVDNTNLLDINYGNDFSKGVRISGNVEITGQLRVVGDTYKKSKGDKWGHYSDARLKQNIKPLTSSLNMLTKLRGKMFEWIDPEEHGTEAGERIPGFIAQEVEEVMPQWVDTDSEGMKMLNIFGFEAFAVEALRELSERVKTLEAQLTEANA